MPKIVIDQRLCKGCNLCVVFCPKGVLSLAEGFSQRGVNPAQVGDESLCSGCLNCAIMCPDAAITITIEERKRKPVAENA